MKVNLNYAKLYLCIKYCFTILPSLFYLLILSVAVSKYFLKSEPCISYMQKQYFSFFNFF